MSNFLYTTGLEKLGTGGINLTGDTLKVQPVSTGSGAYEASQSGDAALDDIPAGARIGTAEALTSVTFTGAVLDAVDLTVVNTATAQVGAVVIYKDSGVESTSWLLAYIDTTTGLPYNAAGGNIPVAWSDGANKIFKLG